MNNRKQPTENQEAYKRKINRIGEQIRKTKDERQWIAAQGLHQHEYNQEPEKKSIEWVNKSGKLEMKLSRS